MYHIEFKEGLWVLMGTNGPIIGTTFHDRAEAYLKIAEQCFAEGVEHGKI